MCSAISPDASFLGSHGQENSVAFSKWWEKDRSPHYSSRELRCLVLLRKSPILISSSFCSPLAAREELFSPARGRDGCVLPPPRAQLISPREDAPAMFCA